MISVQLGGAGPSPSQVKWRPWQDKVAPCWMNILVEKGHNLKVNRQRKPFPMLSAGADQKFMQETPDQNVKSAIEAPAWRSYLQRPGTMVGISLAAIVFLAVLVSFLTGTLSINTVFARGSTEIIATDPKIKVIFSEVATDDPPRTLDPGYEQDVATCRARVQGGTSLSLSILNGYPGYACSLQATLENRGQGAVRLDRLEYEVPPGLNILGPDNAGGLILAPGQRRQQHFTVMVAEDAEEGETHGFHTWHVFTPQD